MKRIITLAIVLTILFGSTLGVSAAIPEPGPGKTNIFVQNIGTGDATVSMVFTTGNVGGQAWQTDTGGTIAPKASKYVLYTQFGGSITDGWAGAVEVSATEPLAAIVNMFWDSAAGIKTAATYTGVDNPATGVYLPNLLKIDQRQTRVTVQNTEDAVADITINFFNRNGVGVGQKQDTIPAKSEKTYFLDQEPAADFNATVGTGSAYITSNRKIAAVASLHWPDASEAYSGVSSGDTTLWVPSVFRRGAPGAWTNYNATIVQNLGDQAANVTVQFINMDNTIQFTMEDTIAPKAAAGYNTVAQGTMDATKFANMTAALGNNWQGTMKFTCTNGQPLAGVSFYFPYSTGVRDSIAFAAIRESDATTKALSFPAVYRKQTGASSDQWSATLIQNIAATAGTLAVEFYNTDGAKVGPTYNVPIGANSSVRLNCKAGLELPQEALNALGNGFIGSIFITPSEGVKIIGVSNIIFDGAGRASGYAGFPVP